VARSTRAAHPLLTVRSLVVSAHKGREVQVDHDPRCSACGKKLGEYFAIPYSIKCRNCGHQAKGD